ncbi:ABC-2 family transporter protein [candidate division WWE3 bacterium]|uniref:ABC-2 family transporter protein n=1 Tax=candidate division WWE3 bacterium TaxID=2053526 RepID=A0A955RNZ0_UNCKA|nr:ABC-2 family transporter protein [candidate division WWE3 bacterium]
MKRNYRLLLAKINYHLAYFYQYRFSSMVHLLSALLWFALGMGGIAIILGNVSSIGGWTPTEIYILMLVFYLGMAVAHATYYNSLADLTRKIQDGRLDFYLLKPVSVRYWVSIDKITIPQFLRAFIVLALLVGYCIAHQVTISMFGIMLAVLYFWVGQILLYQFFLLLMLAAFWIVNAWNIPWFLDRISDAAELPIDTFDKKLRFFVLYITPMAFIAYVPTQALLNRLDPYLAFLALGLIVIFEIIISTVWKIALRQYSSASS